VYLQLKRLIHRGFQICGYGVARFDRFKIISLKALKFQQLFEWSQPQVNPTLYQFIGQNIEHSLSQLQQDLLALYIARKSPGFFVEIGGTNGKDDSNTYLLEKKYAWNGLIVEPARIWKKSLIENRTCAIDFRAVASETGKNLNFLEVGASQLSTLEGFENFDLHSNSRKVFNKYLVETVSLNDLLIFHHAPHRIDLISIDVEGSEFEILKDFQFSNWQVSFWCIEHNMTPSEQAVQDIMSRNGYTRILANVSKFDAWYIESNNSMIANVLPMSQKSEQGK